MPSNSSPECLAHWQDDYYPLLKKKLKRLGNLWRNISEETLFVPHGVPMLPTSSSSKRKMENFNQCKITDPSTNGPNRTEMYRL
jgi:hypothetical protein